MEKLVAIMNRGSDVIIMTDCRLGKVCREGFLFLPCNNKPSPRVAKYIKRTTIKS